MTLVQNFEMTTAQNTTDPFRLWPRVLAGLFLSAALIGGVGGWAVTVPLSGAVISQGVVVVTDSVQNIQHRDGGIISQIAVHEGDFVQRGQVLLRLQDAQTQAEASIVQAQIVELTAKRARLSAERDGLSAIVFPTGYDAAQPIAFELARGEERLFAGQRATRESQKQQLDLGIEQIAKEVEGLEGQHAAKVQEAALIETEYDRTKTMVDRKLTEITRLNTIERERVRAQGELSEIVSSIARARTRISEIRLQILSVDDTSRTDAQRELATVETRLAELNERNVALKDRLSRIEVTAPASGIVNELNVHTLGGVVAPGETLLTLVPQDSPLSIEIRLSPTTIEQVHLGQATRLRFPSFNKRTTPELEAVIAHISPATSRDPATGEHFYQGRVEIAPDQLARLGDARLLPGMPVEVLITTGERTFASYLLKPMVDQFTHAFRER
jgi:HlyD family type I secretion membrane fusion protein